MMTKPLALLITGSRDLGHRPDDNWQTLIETLKKERPATVVIHGGAPGVDEVAARYLRPRSVAVHAVPALWELQGRAAGPRRNALMLELLLTYQKHGYEVAVLGFPLGRSPGTRGMLKMASEHQIRIEITELKA